MVPGDKTQVGLRFVTSDTEQLGPRRLHLHLTSSSIEQQQRTVETALRLGGRQIDVGPDETATSYWLTPAATNCASSSPATSTWPAPATSAR